MEHEKKNEPEKQVSVFSELVQSMLSSKQPVEEFKRNKLALDVQTKELVDRTETFTRAELEMLLQCFPSNRKLIPEISEALLQIIVPKIQDIEPLLERALKNNAPDYVLKLVELVALNNPDVSVPDDYAEWFLQQGRWAKGSTGQVMLDDVEAKILLLTLRIVEETPKGAVPAKQPYSAVLRALKTAPRYSSVRDLRFNGFEFTKLLLIHRASDEMQGVPGLILDRQTTFTQFPFAGRTQGRSKTIATSREQVLNKGYNLRRFIEGSGEHPRTLLPKRKNQHAPDLPVTGRGEYLILPEYEQFSIRGNQPSTRKGKLSWQKRYTVDDTSITLVAPEETHLAFYPKYVVLKTTAPKEGAQLLVEATLPTEDKKLILSTPVTTLTGERKVLGVTSTRTKVSVYVDNVNNPYHYWLQIAAG